MRVVSYRFLGTIWISLLIASGMAACGAEPASPRGDGDGADAAGDTTSAVTPGVAGGPCYPNDSCNAGLACTGGICADPGAAAGVVGGPCYPDNSCNTGLVCLSGVCAVDTTDTGVDTGVDTGDTTDTDGSGDTTDTTDTGVDTTVPPADMVYIPAGTFTMGSPGTEVGRFDEEVQHSVTLSRSFFMGQTEVTQGQWKALSGGTNPSYFQSATGTAQSTANANDSGPVEYLDWYAAVAFANARSAAEGLTSCYTLTGCTDATNGWQDGIHSGCTGATFSGLTCPGYRLPTESEWEYAARGGTTTATYLGDLSGNIDDCTTAQPNLNGIAWWCRNSGDRTNAVGGKTANSFGLYDMLGNVWEWTGDWYGTYPATVTDPTGPTVDSGRVLRGGSWNFAARAARAAYRDFSTPVDRYGDLGFRLSRTAP